MERNLVNHLRNILTRYVNQRERAYQVAMENPKYRYPGREGHLKAISELRRALGHLEGKSLEGHVRMVVRLKESIQRLLPSASSRFRTVRHDIMHLIDYCERQLASYNAHRHEAA